MGEFNFSTEDKILGFIFRGDNNNYEEIKKITEVVKEEFDK